MATGRWTDEITTLMGRNSVTITTGDETNIKGAVVAQINDDGSDSTDGGNLSLTTGSLIVEELNDRDRADNWEGGVSSNSSTSVQFQNDGHVRGQIVHATLGEGEINLTDEHEEVPETLNRDIEQLTTLTANRQTGGANVDVTLDHRMLSAEGWKDIATNFVDTYQHSTDVGAGLSNLLGSGDFGFEDYGNYVTDSYTYREQIKQQVHVEATRAGINEADASAEEIRLAMQNLSLHAEVNLYDGDPYAVGLDESGAEFNRNTSAGGYNTVSGGIGVNIFATDMTSTDDKISLIGHENYHDLASRNDYNFSNETEEGLAHSFGTMSSSSWRAYSWLGGYDTDINSNNSSQSQWYLQNRGSTTVLGGNSIVSDWDSNDVSAAHLRTPMSLTAQLHVGRQWLGTESAERFAEATGLDLAATNGYNFFGPLSTVLQADVAAQEQAGVTRDNAAQSALVLVEQGDTSTSLENYIVAQMGTGFESFYNQSPESQNQLANLLATVQPGEYLNVSGAWQWAAGQVNQRVEDLSPQYADVANNRGSIYNGSVPLFSSWLGSYIYNATVTFDSTAPPAMQAYAQNSLVYGLVVDALAFGTPVKGMPTFRSGMMGLEPAIDLTTRVDDVFVGMRSPVARGEAQYLGIGDQGIIYSIDSATGLKTVYAEGMLTGPRIRTGPPAVEVTRHADDVYAGMRSKVGRGEVRYEGGSDGVVYTIDKATEQTLSAQRVSAPYSGTGSTINGAPILRSVEVGPVKDVTKNGKKIPNCELCGPPNKKGNAPKGKDGHPVELHHRNQKPDGPLDEMTRTDHRLGDNFKKNHPNIGQNSSQIDRKAWRKEQKDYWKREWDSGRFNDM